MPRSAGTYTLPANSLAVSGTTISSTYYNAALNDIASEMTASVPRDGTGAMTGKLAGKSFDEDAITTVASATTTDIGAAATREVTVSGTTTITAFGTAAAGIRVMVRFSGALTLTHNGTSLILPGAANIITVANDSAEFLSLGSGNWICTNYHRVSSTPNVVIQVATYTDAGSTTSSTSYVSANGSAFSFTPKSVNSTLIIMFSANMAISAVTATNTNNIVGIHESGSLVGSLYTISATSATDGLGSSTAGFIQVALANTALTARSFSLYHKANNASAIASTQAIKCTIMEIAA